MATLQITQEKPKRVSSVKHFSYPIIFPSHKANTLTAENIIPFRISFTNITVPGFDKTIIPGIGIQVIGFSNYIL